MSGVAEIAAGLTSTMLRVLSDSRFNPKGWEPRDPFAPTMNAMVELGLFRRANGRCGFEAFKDSFVVPTELGLAVRNHLESNHE